MASDNPQILGQDEIIALSTYPKKIYLEKPFTIAGGVYNNVSSTQARLLINDEIIETTNIQNQAFSFNCTLTVFPGDNVTIKIQGLSSGTVKSEDTQTIPVNYISIAESMAQIYLSLKNVLEECYHENVELYDPTLKTGEGIWTLINKIEEI